MTNKQNKHQSNDLVDGIEETIYLVVEMLLKALFQLLVFVFQIVRMKYTQYISLAPLNSRQLRSKKQAHEIHHVGWSVNNRKPLDINHIKRQLHLAIIGATGVGKSVLLRILQVFSQNMGKPIVVFDPKPTIATINQFIKKSEKYNRKCCIFSPLYKESIKYNPLAEGSPEAITSKIMSALDWSEQYYMNTSKLELLEATREIINKRTEIVTLKKLIDILEQSKHRKDIMGLITQLRSISDSPLGMLINDESKDVLTLSKIRNERANLYIGISFMDDQQSAHSLNKLIFGDFLHHAQSSLTGLHFNGEDPREYPITLFFDELSSTIHSGFIDLLNKCRQAGIEIVYATQSPSDIDSISKELRKQVFENTNGFFIFNQTVPEHTEFLAKMCGTVTTTKRTNRFENNSETNNGSIREVEEYIAHPNLIKSLRVGQCIFYQRNPRRVDLVNVRFDGDEGSYARSENSITSALENIINEAKSAF